MFLASLVIRATAEPGQLENQVARAVRQTHPNLAVLSARTMHTQVERSLRQERLLASLSTAFGLTALFLVCIGLYGVISQWSAQRSREIGLRMALGATSAGVRWMVLRQAFLLVIAGVFVGLPAAAAVGRLLTRMLFGVRPVEPLTFTLAALAMFMVAVLAAYLPARRASRVDPMMALRSE